MMTIHPDAGDRVARARGLIEEALALLDAEGAYVASAHLGHALDLLDAERAVSDPASR